MFIRFLIVTLPIISVITYFTMRLTPEDEIAYHELVQESLELRTRHALEETPALQKRQNVQKDIWTQDETRHLQIKSTDSDLIITQNKEKTEAVEKLKKVNCIIDDEFTLTAELGIYTLSSHQFIAEENCRIAKNNNLIDSTRIHIDLLEEVLELENPKGHLEAGLIDFEAKSLTWDKKHEKLYLKDDVKLEQPDQFTLTANQGLLELDDLKPRIIRLSGNVHLISTTIQDKESFAIADTLTYDPFTETLLFAADKRVLFWQDGLSISAPQVLIHKDRTVQGLGDVHFAFDLEEQGYIDKLFKQYL